MDSSRIAALGSPKPPTIASRRPMLSSQRSLSALSINTNTTHGDMMRRNSSATTANRHRRLQTPNNVPPLPLSAATGSNVSLSPEELSSKIADSFQQFSSMLSQLSNNNNKTATTPVTTPPSNHPAYILSPQKQQLSPRHTTIPTQSSQRSNLLNSPPLSSTLPSSTTTATQNIHRKEVRRSSQPASVVIQPKVPSSVNPTQLQSKLPPAVIKKPIEPKEEEEEIDMDAYHSHAIYFKTALDDITATHTINGGNTELRRRLISKWLTRAASIGDLETMQQMLEGVHDVDINCTDDKKTGMTSLMYASYFGHLQCLDLLLSHPSIKINQQDKSK